MKKVMLLVLVFCLFATPVWAGAFDAQDEEAQQVAEFVRRLLGGKEYEKLLRETYPKAKIEWGGRAWAGDSSDTVANFVIYCEIIQPKTEAVYYYYELKLSGINNIP